MSIYTRLIPYLLGSYSSDRAGNFLPPATIVDGSATSVYTLIGQTILDYAAGSGVSAFPGLIPDLSWTDHAATMRVENVGSAVVDIYFNQVNRASAASAATNGTQTMILPPGRAAVLVIDSTYVMPLFGNYGVGIFGAEANDSGTRGLLNIVLLGNNT